MKNIQGDLDIILASTAFGVMPVLAKLAYGRGATTYTVLFLRFLFAAFILLYIILNKKISLKLNMKQILMVIMLGLFGYSATALCLFISYNYVSVGVATNLLYTYPAIVTLMSRFLYKEKLYGRKIVSLLLSLIGVFILIEIKNQSINITGVSFAFASAIFYSLYVLGISTDKAKKINSYVMIFYLSVTSSIIMFLLGVSTSALDLRIDFYALICIILLAFISTVVALMSFLKGVRIIGPSRAAILSTLEPIVSIILGFLILKEKLSLNMIIGSALVIASVLLLVKDNTLKEPAEN
ncbi:DMT family transporter [Clostridium sp. JN-9]|uniref:DMT family transporter n=1 Tax=Clostridium sp. JN-9 TaxID=2507159 RepID=UPI0013E8A647|nr:DMT family transporter [Clostridium sp. JN-9]